MSTTLTPGVSTGRCVLCRATILTDDDTALQLHAAGCPFAYAPEPLCRECGNPYASVLHLANVCGRGQS